MKVKFSTRAIQYLLNEKMYEKHGITKREYIEICRKKWNSSGISPRVLVDSLLPMSLAAICKECGYHIDFAVEVLLEKIKVDPKKENEEFISVWHIPLFTSNTHEITTKIPISYPTYWSDKNIVEGEYFLGYFDVLGFTNQVESKSPTEVYKLIEPILKKARINKPYVVANLVEPGDEIKPGETYHTLPQFHKVPFKFAYYSDTILFWAPGHYKGAFEGFLAKCIDFFNASLKSQVLLRGVISHGVAILNKSKNIYIGKPIIEAANLEKEQKWAGVMFGDSIYHGQFLDGVNPRLFIQGIVFPLKRIINGKVYNSALNWAGRLRPKEQQDIFKILKEIKYSIPEKNRDYINNTIRLLSTCYSFSNTPKEVSSQLRVSLGFPEDITEIVDAIKVDQEYNFRILFIELVDGRVMSGFIFVVPSQTFEQNTGLNSVLMFVELQNIDQFGTFFLSNKNSMIDISGINWLYFIPRNQISRVYA